MEINLFQKITVTEIRMYVLAKVTKRDTWRVTHTHTPSECLRHFILFQLNILSLRTTGQGVFVAKMLPVWQERTLVCMAYLPVVQLTAQFTKRLIVNSRDTLNRKSTTRVGFTPYARLWSAVVSLARRRFEEMYTTWATEPGQASPTLPYLGNLLKFKTGMLHFLKQTSPPHTEKSSVTSAEKKRERLKACENTFTVVIGRDTTACVKRELSVFQSSHRSRDTIWSTGLGGHKQKCWQSKIAPGTSNKRSFQGHLGLQPIICAVTLIVTLYQVGQRLTPAC